MGLLSRLLALWVVLIGASSGGHADERVADAGPDPLPLLRIETGMHVAPIKSIAVDGACGLLATGSDDKTVRIWALPEGRLLRTVRVPVDEAEGGRIYAVALSPDGRTLVSGGWDAAGDQGLGMGVYITDLANGATRRLGGFEDVADHIAFSPDGQRIGIGLANGQGLRVLDLATGRELLADRDFGDSIYGMAFGPDGSLYATSYDGGLRRYDPDLRLAAKARLTGGRHPYAVAPDPSGRLLGVGYEDTPAVSIIDAATLTPVAEALTQDLAGGNLSSLAWAADGLSLLAGGEANTMADGERKSILRRFDRAGRRVSRDVVAAGDTVTDLKACGGGIFFASGEPGFGFVGPGGDLRSIRGPVAADMRLKLGGAFTLSADASRLGFGLGYGGARPVVFDLSAGTLVEADRAPGDLRPANIEALPVTAWKDGPAPRFKDLPIGLDDNELSRSLAVRADRGGFVLGSVYRLRSFDARGRELWSVPVPATAWGVNLDRTGDVVVVASGDGTIRWSRGSDGRPLLALFVNRDTREWVAWTPSGYYMASPGGEDMIGWHVNRGWDQAADFFPASRFRATFDRPDIVRRILATRDEAEAVRQANAAARRQVEDKPIITRLPPVLAILSPSDGSVVAGATVDIGYETRSPSGVPVDRVEAFVDGSRVETRGLAPLDQAAAGTITLPMPPHDATLSLVAYAGGLAGDAARIMLKHKVEAGPADDDPLKPKLYALLVGVTHYGNAAYDLVFPAKDATDFAEALKSQKGKLYRDVEVRVLTDGDATAAALKHGLYWLKKETTERDLAIVFVAGHGITDARGKFWFLTSDANPEELAATAVSREDMTDIIYEMPGKKMLFLDACHSGAALTAAGTRGLEPLTDVSKAVSDFAQAEGGVVAFAASTGHESSFERAEWGHGAFTKALIEGFEGEADLLRKGTITTSSLEAYVDDRVKDLTGGRQHPVMTRPKTVPDFPIALLR